MTQLSKPRGVPISTGSTFDKNIPQFTVDQLLWLDSTFPELVDTQASANALYINLGARRVIKKIESLISEAKRQNSGG